MQIRPVTEADTPEISDFLGRCWHHTYDHIYGVEEVTRITGAWHNVEALKARLQRPGSVFLTAIDQRQIVGMAYAAPGDPGEAILHQLYVDAGYHGAGLAPELLDRIEAAFPEAESIVLEVEEQNARAVAFYIKHGYRQVGVTDDCGEPSSGIPALTFAKQIHR